ncbi:uncharacterized protein LOC113469686 [Diaphorina citri]|uniref:Uncharacterized protein LOC113469686 n=1 Tax=Diaphorina citri TaxID=121845 RepID=A0A3Q0J9F7_DIACI|nr:uncharacterized protein LOC113469686 [Diaphorina citri]
MRVMERNTPTHMCREKWFLAKGPSRLTSKILKSVRTNMVHHCLRVRACCMRVMERNTPTRMCSEKWFLAKGPSRLVSKILKSGPNFTYKHVACVSWKGIRLPVCVARSGS